MLGFLLRRNFPDPSPNMPASTAPPPDIDAEALFGGVVDAARDGDGVAVRPRRLRVADLPLAHPQLAGRATNGAGCRLQFLSDAAAWSVRLDPCLDGDAPEHRPFWIVDLLVDGVLHERRRVDRVAEAFRFDGWPAGPHRFDLFFDVVSEVAVGPVRAEGATFLRPAPPAAGRLIAYGSSITQSGNAEGPAEAWPAVAAARLGLDHLNLGYGGNGHLDPIVARTMATLPASLLFVCANVNMHAHGYNPRTFGPTLLGFLQTLRDGHPRTPLVCCSAIHSPERETEPGDGGLTLAFMREETREVVEALQQRGDDRLHLLDGLDVLGPGEAHLLGDGLHPGAEGCRFVGHRIADLLERHGIAAAPVAPPA